MKDYTHGPRPGFWLMLWRMDGLLPLILAVVTIVFSVLSFGTLRDGLRFEAEGVETKAEILDRTQERVRRDYKWVTEYHVVIGFVAAGADYDVRKKVSSSDFEASEIGSERTVRYLRGTPTHVEFKVGETMSKGRSLRWAALGFGLLALAALWWKGSRAVDAIRARKFGAVERVTVNDVLVHRGKNSTSYRLQWFDKSGQLGSSLPSSRRDRYDGYPKHSTVEIFRGAKGRAWWVGDVGPRAEARTVPSVGKSS